MRQAITTRRDGDELRVGQLGPHRVEAMPVVAATGMADDCNPIFGGHERLQRFENDGPRADRHNDAGRR